MHAYMRIQCYIYIYIIFLFGVEFVLHENMFIKHETVATVLRNHQR